MINEMLKVERGDNVFPRRNVAAFAEVDIAEVGRAPIQRASFGVDSEYTLFLKVGVDFVSNDVELQRKTDNARKQLMHAIFKDVISELHEIGNLVQDSESSSKIYSLVEKLQSA